MSTKSLIIIKQRTNAFWRSIRPKIKRVALRLAFFFLIFLLLSNQEISFHIHIGNQQSQERFSNKFSASDAQASFLGGTSLWGGSKTKDIRQQKNLANAATATSRALTKKEKKQAAQFSNLGFLLNEQYAEEHGLSPRIVAFKKKKCLDYVQKYKQTALEEAQLYGIPAAITLAQALLESNAGDSRLAKKDNNHFGIKCRQKCIGCRCANYTDDSRYDMFRIFDSPWYSFRAHSDLLKGSRYKHLLQLSKDDYKNWAHGLEAAGYATDKQYAEKLIKIIEALNLNQI